jgi:hypothetical protein
MSKKLQETLNLCREFNVKHIKTADFEIELNPAPPPPIQVGPDASRELLKALTDDMPSDDELLKASSPYEDEKGE